MTTPAMKSIFDHLFEVVGGDPKVIGCQRDEGPEEVDVMHVADQPTYGLTAWATIGMYLGETGNEANGKPLRVELISMCDSSVRDYGNILASCAFNVLTGDYGIMPGNIFPDVVSQYLPDVTMKHMLFVPVFAWDGPRNLDVDGVTVTWLQAVPVSQTEFTFVRGNGADALQNHLEEADADVADLNRQPVA